MTDPIQHLRELMAHYEDARTAEVASFTGEPSRTLALSHKAELHRARVVADLELTTFLRNLAPQLLEVVESASEMLADHEAKHGRCDRTSPDICMYCRARQRLAALGGKGGGG